MAFWRNSSIRTKVLLAFGSVFLAAAGLGLFDMSQTARVEAAAENIRDEWLPSTAGLGRLAMAASAYRNAEGRALIAALSNDADGTRRSVAEYAAATTVADRLLRDYRAQINPDTYEFQTMHDFDVGWNRTKQLGAEVISLIEHGKAPAAVSLYTGEDRTAFRQALGYLQADMAWNSENGRKVVDRSAAVYETARWLTLLALVATAMICGVSGLALAASVVGPLRRSTRIVHLIARGEMSVAIPETDRGDEIGRLMRCLAAMQIRLRDRAAETLALLHEKERAATSLRQTNLRFDTALSNMAHGVVMADGLDRIVVVNRRFCDFYGFDPEAIAPGCAYRDLIVLDVAAGNHAGCTIDQVVAEHVETLLSRQPTTFVRKPANGRTIAITHEPMSDGGWIELHEDITERRRSEERIVFLAQHDPLTRLPNRALFQERLEQALAHAERTEGFALLYLDVDQFKAVNDTLGHPIGDELLREVALRLRDVVRESDTVARLGGDEFAILQLGVSLPTDATTLARRIVRTVGAPYELQGHRVVVGVSIGIALAPGDATHPTQLLKNADLALYRAKREGRGTWRFFEPKMDAIAQARRAMELDLRSALLLQQLEVYYQPVVCCRTRCVTGFEALLRWHHPTRGMVPPLEFISVAEEIGLIVPIGAWVLQQACTEASGWPDHLKVAVNLSPVQFRGHALVGTVADAMRSSGIAPARMGLEITESVLLEDNSATLSILHELRKLGARISMDDFGTGYSSLSYLRSFPFDTIKIDRSFVAELQTHDECLAIVRAVTGLGSSLHMNTIAEGVETEGQFAILAAEGCNEIQGYLLSKPVPAHKLPALIALLSAPEPPLPAQYHQTTAN